MIYGLPSVVATPSPHADFDRADALMQRMDDQQRAQWDHCTVRKLKAVMAQMLACGRLTQADLITLAVTGACTAQDTILAQSDACNDKSQWAACDRVAALIDAEMERQFWSDQEENAV